jgi:phosphate starvation-inducible membrane PsiE
MQPAKLKIIRDEMDSIEMINNNSSEETKYELDSTALLFIIRLKVLPSFIPYFVEEHLPLIFSVTLISYE